MRDVKSAANIVEGMFEMIRSRASYTQITFVFLAARHVMALPRRPRLRE